MKEEDITTAEDVVRALKPMRTATQVMLEENSPTLSVIAPLHALLLKEMTSLPEDSKDVEIKDEIKKNLSTRSAYAVCVCEGERMSLYIKSNVSNSKKPCGKG